MKDYITTLDDLRLKASKYLARHDARDPRGNTFIDPITTKTKIVTYTYLITLLTDCEANHLTPHTQAIYRALDLSAADVSALLKTNDALSIEKIKKDLFQADEALSSPYGSHAVQQLLALNLAIQSFKKATDDQQSQCKNAHQMTLVHQEAKAHELKKEISILEERYLALSYIREQKFFLEWDCYNQQLDSNTPLSAISEEAAVQALHLGKQIDAIMTDKNALAHPAFTIKSTGHQVKSILNTGIASMKHVTIPEGYDFNASDEKNTLAMQLVLVKNRLAQFLSYVIKFNDLHDAAIHGASAVQKIRISK